MTNDLHLLPREGIVHGMPEDEYHGGTELSNSGITDLLRSPFHYWAMHINPDRPEQKEKPGQQAGTLAHCATLEPHRLEQRFAVGPDARRNSNAWKDAEAEAKERGKILVKPDEYATAKAQAESILSIPDLRKALEQGNTEVSAFWTDRETGVRCRVRPDIVYETPHGIVLFDLKTFGDASPDEFLRQIARKTYQRQGAMYCDGYGAAADADVRLFVFVAIEDKYPFAVSAIRLDGDSREAGWLSYRRGLSLYAEHERKGWPSAPCLTDGIIEARIPEWAIMKAFTEAEDHEY